MSTEQGRVAALIIQEAFGEVVEKVGRFLIKSGNCNLPGIIKGIDLEKTQIKKSLCILIQHKHVTYVQKKRLTIYRIDLDSILRRIRFPRYIYEAKIIFGDAGESIMEDLLQQGHTLMSQCVRRVTNCLMSRLEDTKDNTPQQDREGVGEIVKQQFKLLIEGRFVQRVAMPVARELEGKATEDVARERSTSPVADNRFVLPSSMDAMTVDGNKRKRSEIDEAEDEQPKSKKRRKESSSKKEMPDAGIVWEVNHVRFQQHSRDKAIVSAVARQVDETGASVVKTLLDLALPTPSLNTPVHTQYSKNIQTHKIADAMPDKPKLSRSELEQYLQVLVDQQSKFIQKSEEAGGGSYFINFKKASEILCRATVECIVRERFGSKAFRVFRLLLLKTMLDQKQVADMVMMPSKEAKEILYTLLAENFVNLQEIPKTTDYAPSRTFYLFSVHLLPVSLMVRERCYKALGNLITKVCSETKDNKRLFDKLEQHERQMEEMKAGEMEELLTPDEKEKIATVKRNITRLEHAELQLDETIANISDYISLHTTQTNH